MLLARHRQDLKTVMTLSLVVEYRMSMKLWDENHGPSVTLAAMPLEDQKIGLIFELATYGGNNGVAGFCF